MPQPLANRLAEYASRLRFEDLPAPVVHEAKRRFIDSFATAVGALDAEAYAIAMAGVANTALRQTRSGELSMWKGCAFANAARNGVFAALLAAEGLTGPAPIFEGDLGFMKLLTGPFELPRLGGENGQAFMITN